MQHALGKWDMVFPPASRYCIQGDGNCQFRALSWACYGSECRHAEVRETVCQYMQQNMDKYKDCMTSSQYVDDMRRQGTFGDQLTLQAFADSYRTNLLVLDDDEQATLVQASRAPKDSKYMTLLFERGNHYNAVSPHDAYATNILLAQVKERMNFENRASFA